MARKVMILAAAVAAGAVALMGCERPRGHGDGNGAERGGGAVVTPSAISPEVEARPGAVKGSAKPREGSEVSGAPRLGMAWVPPGALRAGTPIDRSPRIAEEELPGTDLTMEGFYIDQLPFPNEPGAIPTANVTRDEAAKLCEGKGKRLCSEAEWERACKGPDNRTYEYGDGYRAQVCGTGTAVEQAARRPSGERTACVSGFGVREMHGGVWEWTDSPWQRGDHEGRDGPNATLGVLRGGNALAGELAGRCANAIARPATGRAPTMGFRCCAGTRSAAVLRVPLQSGPALERVPLRKAEGSAPHLAEVWGPVEWRWRPVPNEDIRIRGECEGPSALTCTCRIYRPAASGTGAVSPADSSAPAELEVTRTATGRALCGVVQPSKNPKDLRMIYMDGRPRSRTVRYAYGRIDVGPPL